MTDFANTFTARGRITHIVHAEPDHCGRARRILAFDFTDSVGKSGRGSVCILFSGSRMPPDDLAVGDVCDVQFRLIGSFGSEGHERQVTCLLTGGHVTVVERARATYEETMHEREESPEEFARHLKARHDSMMGRRIKKRGE